MRSFDVAMKEQGQIKQVSAQFDCCMCTVLYFSYYYHITSTAVYPVLRYFSRQNAVDEILSTAHP